MDWLDDIFTLVLFAYFVCESLYDIKYLVFEALLKISYTKYIKIEYRKSKAKDKLLALVKVSYTTEALFIYQKEPAGLSRSLTFRIIFQNTYIIN